ncbi:MAG: PIN domain-containing protein [Actinobacteria bacterium]|nr:PIN domain-containing protein [Actinomycetota bacterium]
MVEIDELLYGHKKVGIDTSIFIYHFESNKKYLPITRNILRLLSSGSFSAVISEITIMEILVRPLQFEKFDVADEYETLIDNFPNLEVNTIDRRISRRAAEIRAKYSLKPADAIQIATAIASGATAFISNDLSFKKVDELNILMLDDLIHDPGK